MKEISVLFLLLIIVYCSNGVNTSSSLRIQSRNGRFLWNLKRIEEKENKESAKAEPFEKDSDISKTRLKGQSPRKKLKFNKTYKFLQNVKNQTESEIHDWRRLQEEANYHHQTPPDQSIQNDRREQMIRRALMNTLALAIKKQQDSRERVMIPQERMNLGNENLAESIETSTKIATNAKQDMNQDPSPIPGENSDKIFSMRRADSSLEDVLSGSKKKAEKIKLQINSRDEVNKKIHDDERRKERFADQVNAVGVLEKVRKMQEEIRRLNAEIDAENKRILEKEQEVEKVDKLAEDQIEEENPGELNLKDLEKEAKVQSMLSKMREMKLKKEDAKMKAIETQLKLKKLQKTDNTSRTFSGFDAALDILAARRKLIRQALARQRLTSANRQKLTLQFLENRQKNNLERQRLSNELKRQRIVRLTKEREKKQREIAAMLKLQKDALKEAQSLVAHRSLIEASNQRVLARLRDMNLKRQQEAQRLKNQIIRQEVAKINAEKLSMRLRQRQKIRPSSPILRLTVSEMNQLLSWLDLERNAEILKSNDAKIAAKNGETKAAKALIRNAAQMALGEDDFQLTDSEVDDLLGIDGPLNLDGPFDQLDPLDPNIALNPIVPDTDNSLDDSLEYEYEYPDDGVDLEDILVNYEYEYDDTILPPTGSIAPGVIPSILPLTPAAPESPVVFTTVRPDVPYHRPQSHSYQHFYHLQPSSTPAPYYSHNEKPKVHFAPEVHVSTPTPVHEVHHVREKPLHGDFQHYFRPSHIHSTPAPITLTPTYDHGSTYDIYHNDDSEYYYKHPEPQEYYKPTPHHQESEYYYNDEYNEPSDSEYYKKTPLDYRELKNDHISYRQGHKISFFNEPGPPYIERYQSFSQPKEDQKKFSDVHDGSGVKFLSEAAHPLDSSPHELKAQRDLPGQLEKSILHNIQDTLDKELSFGSTHHTRRKTGKSPHETKRNLTIVQDKRGNKYGDNESFTSGIHTRSKGNSRRRPKQLDFDSESNSSTFSEEHRVGKKKLIQPSFSDLMSDFLLDHPLPFMQKKI